ncbi:hypothetical protein BU26DRAFT_553063 [Trematosphaeria pertusa]|uniref:Uncharacterized protein n=1 Tax=Trematosphaeria pertusa TaxID=390896 RepID=A0A6A6I6F7_9PLEO|nr:uncharacterized protein BU26DRAFT_553063 [Trematosphaeria pertusa]KAF2246105.1 hypothetical protein BU26DRAFT_553063 [Trematosphaeria pertusa]
MSTSTSITTPPQEGPFFSHLNYDVRITTYEHIDDLPPFARQTEFAGFFLSCRQAKQELEEAATLRLTKYLNQFKAEFEQKTGFTVGIPTISTFYDLRVLKINLPFAAIQDKNCSSFSPGVLGALLPLSTKFFDKLYMQFVYDPEPIPHRRARIS